MVLEFAIMYRSIHETQITTTLVDGNKKTETVHQLERVRGWFDADSGAIRIEHFETIEALLRDAHEIKVPAPHNFFDSTWVPASEKAIHSVIEKEKMLLKHKNQLW
jgi:hypothetical protein